MAGISAKIFKSDSDLPIEKIYNLLKSSKKMVDIIDDPETGKSKSLEFFIESLKMMELNNKTIIRGILTYDDSFEIKGQDNFIKLVISRKSVSFTIFSGSMYVALFVRSSDSDDVIHKIFRLSPSSMNINSCVISTDNIENFLRRHPHQLTACSWRDLTIPGLSRSSLGGPNITNTEDFTRYDDRGKKRYVRVLLNANGWSLTINDQASLHFYTTVSMNDIEVFLINEIIPRCN